MLDCVSKYHFTGDGMKFDQLIFRRIVKIVATKCQILRLKCTKIDFGWGPAPDPAGVAYSAPPNPPLWAWPLGVATRLPRPLWAWLAMPRSLWAWLAGCPAHFWAWLSGWCNIYLEVLDELLYLPEL